MGILDETAAADRSKWMLRCTEWGIEDIRRRLDVVQGA